MSDENVNDQMSEDVEHLEDNINYENPTLHDVVKIMSCMMGQIEELQDSIIEEDDRRNARWEANNDRINRIIGMAEQMVKQYLPSQSSPLGMGSVFNQAVGNVPFTGSAFEAFGASPITPPPSPDPKKETANVPPATPGFPPNVAFAGPVYNPAYNSYSGAMTRPTPEQYVTVPLSYIGELVMALAKRP